ncbi:hypothetical protein ACRYI5_10720 [Furfurilactobacillus sp. WILCCON 0119]
MNEDYLNFLENPQIQCLQLLNIGLLNGNGLAIAKNNIQQSLGISYYKLSQTIVKLNDDLSLISGNDTFYVSGDGDTVTFFQISSKIEKKLRALYATTSDYFLMFEYLYLNERAETRQEFMSRTFMSISHFFTLRNKVIRITQDHFHMTEHSAEGLKRQVVFNVFYYFFNGIRFPFINLETVTLLIQKLQEVYQFQLRPTQLEQLRYFCAIQISRGNNSHSISYVPLHITTSVEAINITKNFYNEIISSEDDLSNEAAFTHDFLHVTGMISFDFNILTPKVRKKIQQLTDIQITILREKLNFFDKNFNFSNVTTSLNQINLHLEFPFFISSTFSDPDKVRFFKETYPQLHETVMILINQTIKRTFPSAKLQTITQLYYTVIFSIMLNLPLNAYSEAIYVTVDFSQGDLYTNYITQAIKQLGLSNLVVEQQLSSHTDLYLSDIFVNNMVPEQVTWENPPKPIDWQDLGDSLIAIQNKKYGAHFK